MTNPNASAIDLDSLPVYVSDPEEPEFDSAKLDSYVLDVSDLSLMNEYVPDPDEPPFDDEKLDAFLADPAGFVAVS
jgi:hypothetical protein